MAILTTIIATLILTKIATQSTIIAILIAHQKYSLKSRLNIEANRVDRNVLPGLAPLTLAYTTKHTKLISMAIACRFRDHAIIHIPAYVHIYMCVSSF